jgi:hypothetical protein
MSKLNLVSSFYKPRHILELLGYLLPVMLVAIFIFAYGVNVPYFDQLALVDYFEAIQNGSVTLSDIFAQYNEHRIAFPRIIFASLAFSTCWNTFYEFFCSMFLAFITLIFLLKIAKMSNPSPSNMLT